MPGAELLSSLSVSVACYNEVATVGDVIDGSAAVASKIAREFRVFVVDDGSTDGSTELLRDMARTRPWLVCHHHGQNQGFGATWGRLYRFNQCDYNAIIPGDAQFPPDQLAVMAKGLQEADVVIGRRITRNDPLRRKLNSRFYNGLISMVAGRPVHDVNSISMARTDLVRRFTLESHSAFIHAEFLLEAFRHNGRVTEIEIAHRERVAGVASGGKISVIVSCVGELAQYVRQRGLARGSKAWEKPAEEPAA